MNDILEMLGALEDAVGRLGAERVALAASLRDAERRLKTIGNAARTAKPKRKAAAPSRRRKAVAAPVPEPVPAAEPQLQESPQPSPADEPPERPARKRQALGRGLSQLRRLPAAPKTEA